MGRLVLAAFLMIVFCAATEGAFARDKAGNFSARMQKAAAESSCGACITYGPPGKPAKHSCCTNSSKSVCDWVEAEGGYIDNCMCRLDASCR